MQVHEPRVLFGMRNDVRGLANDSDPEAWMWGGKRTDTALERFAREGACVIVHLSVWHCYLFDARTVCVLTVGTVRFAGSHKCPAEGVTHFVSCVPLCVCCCAADCRVQALPMQPVLRHTTKPVYPEDLEEGLARYSSALQVSGGTDSRKGDLSLPASLLVPVSLSFSCTSLVFPLLLSLHSACMDVMGGLCS
jgi:hypothetical protein